LNRAEQAFIHIGLEKTGSTFLQDFLHLNFERLVEIGLYKSRVLVGKNDYRLALLGQDRDSISNQVNNYCNIPTEFVEESNSSLLNLIAQSHSREHHFLASSELISSCVLKLSEIERFKAGLDSIFLNVKILVFVRRQEQLLLSRYSTAIIHGHQGKFPTDINKVSVAPAIDIIAILSLWQRVFGENLLVLPYFEDSDRAELVHRFFHSIGILKTDLSEFEWPETKSNSSLSATGLETLRTLNEKIEKTPKDLKEQIVGYIKKRTHDEGKFGVTESFHDQLRTKFMSINKRASYFLDPFDREDFLNSKFHNPLTSTGPNLLKVEELLEEIVSLFFENDLAISKLLLK
jgi:hypothetical protein